VVLLLAVLINPVFASVGDLHEAVRGSAEHLHSAEEHGLTQDATQDEDGKGGDLLHALMHAAHCCGHLSAIPASFVLPAVALVGSQAPHTEVLRSTSIAVASEIRPPIAL
jgi:hypothetical protein